jgi:hypothetical protein
MNLVELVTSINETTKITKTNMLSEIDHKLRSGVLLRLDVLLRDNAENLEVFDKLTLMKSAFLDSNSTELYYKEDKKWVDYRKKETFLALFVAKIAREMFIFNRKYIEPVSVLGDCVYNICRLAKDYDNGYYEQKRGWVSKLLIPELMGIAKFENIKVFANTTRKIAWDGEDPYMMRVNVGFKLNPNYETPRGFNDKILELFRESQIEYESTKEKL